MTSLNLIFRFVIGSLVGDVWDVISLVSGGSVSGLGVGSGLVVVSLGVSLVLNVSDVAGIAINVISDDLLATVGENNGVGAGGLVTIAGLVLVHIDVVVIVLDCVIVFVVSGGLLKPYDNI